MPQAIYLFILAFGGLSFALKHDIVEYPISLLPKSITQIFCSLNDGKILLHYFILTFYNILSINLSYIHDFGF